MTAARCLFLALGAGLSGYGASLDEVLARMDVAAKQFKSYSATAKVTDYTRQIDDTYQRYGSFRLRRIKGKISGIMDLTDGKDRTVIHFNGPEIEIYPLKSGAVQVFKAGQYKAALNEMLLLGFSVGRDELRNNYDTKLGEAEKLGPVYTARVVLTPKSAQALRAIQMIELWIPAASGNPIRQKVTHPNGDYHLVEYSDVKLNPTLPDSAFELALPPGTRRVPVN